MESKKIISKLDDLREELKEIYKYINSDIRKGIKCENSEILNSKNLLLNNSLDKLNIAMNDKLYTLILDLQFEIDFKRLNN